MAVKNPGLGARKNAYSAALDAARGAAESSEAPAAPTDSPERVKGVSLRLPLEMWRQVSTLSHNRQQAKAGEVRKRGDADEDSIHGILLKALHEYLEREDGKRAK